MHLTLNILLRSILAEATNDPQEDAAPLPRTLSSAAELEEVFKTHNHVIVEFMTKNCHYCKLVKPEIEKLTAADSVTPTYVVDCSTEPAATFCKDQNIAGYPTIQLMAKDFVCDFKGARKAEAIAHFYDAVSKKVVEPLHVQKEAVDKTIDSFIKEQREKDGSTSLLVLVLAEMDEQATKDRMLAPFKCLETPHLILVSQTTARLVTVFAEVSSKFEQQLDENSDVGALVSENAQYGLLAPLNPSLFAQAFGAGKLIAMHVLKDLARIPEFHAVYVKNRQGLAGEKAVAFAVDPAANPGSIYAKVLGIGEESSNFMLFRRDAESSTGIAKFRLEGVANNETIEQFFLDVAEGKVEQFMKSEPEPEVDAAPGAVEVVVGTTYEQFLKKAGESVGAVLLLKYTAQQGQERQAPMKAMEVAAEIARLAEQKYLDEKPGKRFLRVGSVDMIANEHKDFKLEKKAIFMLVKADGSKVEIASVEDEGTVGVLSWIEKEIGINFSQAEPDSDSGEL